MKLQTLFVLILVCALVSSALGLGLFSKDKKGKTTCKKEGAACSGPKDKSCQCSETDVSLCVKVIGIVGVNFRCSRKKGHPGGGSHKRKDSKKNPPKTQ